MNSSPEPIKEHPDNLTKSGIKAYSTALRISKIGCISSFVLLLLGILSIFSQTGDTTGPGFTILVILALVVLVVSGAIAIFTSMVGIANSIITIKEDKKFSEEIQNALIKNVGLILGIILASLFVYKFLKNYIW